MAINPNTTFTAGAILTASQMNRLPYGVMQYAGTATIQTGITSITDLTSLSATWTAIAGRTYLIQAFATAVSSVAADSIGLAIATSGGTTVAIGHAVSNTNAVAVALNVSYKVSPSAGSVTYKLRGQRGAGTGNVSFQADGLTPSYILVTDLGPA
jgi:hypothetical protein